jgi:hypothetical protein
MKETETGTYFVEYYILHVVDLLLSILFYRHLGGKGYMHIGRISRSRSGCIDTIMSFDKLCDIMRDNRL